MARGEGSKEGDADVCPGLFQMTAFNDWQQTFLWPVFVTGFLTPALQTLFSMFFTVATSVE